jgi:predicted transcriptional regulator
LADLLGRGAQATDLASATVAEIMTPLAFFLPETATLADAIERMASQNVHRLVVIDRAERVTGVVTTLDVVRWLAR